MPYPGTPRMVKPFGLTGRVSVFFLPWFEGVYRAEDVEYIVFPALSFIVSPCSPQVSSLLPLAAQLQSPRDYYYCN